MNFMKRAFLYVSRKRGKSILLFFILLILSTFVLTGLSIGSASKQAQKNLRQNIGGSFNIDVNYSDSNPYYHEEESENEDGSSDLLMYSTEQVTSSVIVLSLILTLWGKERIHETGVLLSIGIKKSSILGQYLIEVLMIAILAFTLSFVTSNMISGNIANTLLQQNTKNEKQQLSTQEDHTEMKSLDFSVSEDSESATPDIKVEITLPDILQLYTIGFSIIFISVTISSISVMRLKPREILARMS